MISPHCFRSDMIQMETLKQTTISALTFMLLTKLAGGFVYCPEWEYQPAEGQPCVPCSECPENEIVRETCSGTRDTVCGPFTEFRLFPKMDSLPLNGAEDYGKGDTDGVNKDNGVGVAEPGSWQTITIVMICVLSVTGVLFVVLVAVTWHLCRRQNKEMLLTQTDQGKVISLARYVCFTLLVSLSASAA